MFHLSFTVDDFKRVVWTFIFGFLVTFIGFASGWATLPNKSDATAALWASLLAAGAAALSAIKNLIFADGSALK